MKSFVLKFIGLCVLAFCSVQGSPLKVTNSSGSKILLGVNKCTWGPSYWCSNFRNAKTCGAVSHCIQTVWEKQHYPIDNDEICNICLDMVKQARDQLESNETQADLKTVFEGSCNLIPIGVVKTECLKLVDDFIPELVEALASQMNPNVVCSVAGLCNNEAIDKILENTPAIKPQHDVEGFTKKTSEPAVVHKDKFNCDECFFTARGIERRFHSTKRDSVLERFLFVCGQMSSYSDACSSLLLTYFGDIYKHLKLNLKAENVCHLSGVCVSWFHEHETNQQIEHVKVRSMGDVGVLPVAGDDVPCKLCEQLVDHLREVLIANTTELEFKHVLEGLCRQTKTFADECNSLVQQYYREIYETLVHNLNSSDACFMIGICPKEGETIVDNVPVMPLLPLDVAVQHEQIRTSKPLRYPLLGENEQKFSVSEVEQAQLPIDRIMGAPSVLNLVGNDKFCTLCEYFMHFVQEALSEPTNEDEIKHVVKSACNRLPLSIRGECHNFVDVYGDAVIALLIQSMDPRQICPTLKMCQTASQDVEIFAPGQIEVTIEAVAGNGKPTCPLCLFAASQLEESIKTNRSKENIKSELSKLCIHMSPKLRLECNDFVDTYTPELVEMLASDFTPQEICVFLKLCVDQRPDLSLLEMELDYEKRTWHQQSDASASFSGDIKTNEIPDITVNGQTVIDHMIMRSTPECLICQEMVKEVEKRVRSKKSKAQIREALEHACTRFGKYKTKCEKYIDQHSDQIIDLVMQQLTPKEICNKLGFCVPVQEAGDVLQKDEVLFNDIEDSTIVEAPIQLFGIPKNDVEDIKKNQPPQCAICEFVMIKVEAELEEKKTHTEIENAVRTVCDKMPSTITKQCFKFIDQYGEFIIQFLQTLPPQSICTRLDLCQKQLSLVKPSEQEIVECGVCQGAVTALEELMLNDQIQEPVTKNVNGICNVLPAKYYAHCDSLLTVYGTSMLQQLKHSIKREQVCINIDICNAMPNLMVLSEFESGEHTIEGPIKEHVEKQEFILIGINECSWGPSFWCKDVASAEKCKSTNYCKDRKLGFWMETL